MRINVKNPISKPLAKLGRRVKRLFRSGEDADHYLTKCRGVIHVGANTGQERDIYHRHGLNVIWVEPIPEVYDALVAHIAEHPRQRAIRALVTDRDGEIKVLNVANNGGASSSILDLHDHKDIWPSVHYVGKVECVSKTLVTILAEAGIDPAEYDALVMDTQGSELLVLKGAEPWLHHFKYIKTEAADFEAYRGCVQLDELVAFLTARGFRVRRKDRFAKRSEGGAYFDLLLDRK